MVSIKSKGGDCWPLMKYFIRAKLISCLTHSLNIPSSISLAHSCNCEAKAEYSSLTLPKVISHLLIFFALNSIISWNFISFYCFSFSNSTMNLSFKINLDSYIMQKLFKSRTFTPALRYTSAHLVSMLLLSLQQWPSKNDAWSNFGAYMNCHSKLPSLVMMSTWLSLCCL